MFKKKYIQDIVKGYNEKHQINLKIREKTMRNKLCEMCNKVLNDSNICFSRDDSDIIYVSWLVIIIAWCVIFSKLGV